LDIFSRFNPIPSSKQVTFYKNEPFDVVAEYAQPELLPAGTDLHLGKFTVPVPKKPDQTEVTNQHITFLYSMVVLLLFLLTLKLQEQKIRVRVKKNLHDMFVVEEAQLAEAVKEEPPASTTTAPAAATEPTKMETDQPPSQPESQPKTEEPTKVGPCLSLNCGAVLCCVLLTWQWTVDGNRQQQATRSNWRED
jgi:hypothetical protein